MLSAKSGGTQFAGQFAGANLSPLGTSVARNSLMAAAVRLHNQNIKTTVASPNESQPNINS